MFVIPCTPSWSPDGTTTCLQTNHFLILENDFLILGNDFLILENDLLILENQFLILENQFLILRNCILFPNIRKGILNIKK